MRISRDLAGNRPCPGDVTREMVILLPFTPDIRCLCCHTIPDVHRGDCCWRALVFSEIYDRLYRQWTAVDACLAGSQTGALPGGPARKALVARSAPERRSRGHTCRTARRECAGRSRLKGLDPQLKADGAQTAGVGRANCEPGGEPICPPIPARPGSRRCARPRGCRPGSPGSSPGPVAPTRSVTGSNPVAPTRPTW